MTKLGRREECLRNVRKKGISGRSRAHQMQNRTLPGDSGSTVKQNLAERGRSAYTVSWMESQNGNPRLMIPPQ